MTADDGGGYEELPRRVQRRLAVVSLLRSCLVATAIFVGYFVLPMDHVNGATAVLELTLGLLLVTAVLAWQIREIALSPYPRVRVLGALATSVPLFFGVFATTYYLLGQADPGNFNVPLTKLDCVYFTVTVFATVGFGDIVAVSEGARAAAVVQMLGDLVIVGFVARAIVNAVQLGLSRRQP